MMCKMYKSAVRVYMFYTDNIEKINKIAVSISMFVTTKIQQIKVLKQKVLTAFIVYGIIFSEIKRCLVQCQGKYRRSAE